MRSPALEDGMKVAMSILFAHLSGQHSFEYNGVDYNDGLCSVRTSVTRNWTR